MLECYIDYVGFKTCIGSVYETSPSGLYLTQLPGLTFENVDKIADEFQRTWKGVYDDVQKMSLPKFYRDLINQLNSCYSLTKDCDYENDIFCNDDNMVVLSNAWLYLLGIGIMQERIYSPRLNRYTTIDKKDAIELKDLYQVEYEKALTDGVKALNTDACELCCGGNIEHVPYYP